MTKDYKKKMYLKKDIKDTRNIKNKHDKIRVSD